MNISGYLNKNTKAAPLAAFRIFFGLMMLASIIRFWSYGWIDKLYIQPKYFFSYYGFEWVRPLGTYTYIIFFICGLSAFLIAIGYKYRLAAITFFLSFTYIELMDKTTYLNHYYFISLIGFLMIFLPANTYFSVDAAQKPEIRNELIPNWCIDSIKLMLGIVYFYAGLAKLNSDWMIHAMPLRIWLPSNYDLWILGDLLQIKWVIYIFSWCGALYDLTIPFLLLYKRTRVVAFVLVVVFHVLTRVLFPIGMFPYIMIVSALIFFDASLHEKIISKIATWLNISLEKFKTATSYKYSKQHLVAPLFGLFFLIQIIFPFRHILYPGELFWTEEGFRFSWRVMLMEKAGYAQFKIKDDQGNEFLVNNSDFLTAFQEKQMATQPDFILEYAHILKNHYLQQGIQNPQVFVDSHVALNGRRSKPYIDPTVNLVEQKESLLHKTWILPFEDEIKGI